jgi:acyl-CoA synthetase (AMP-forming)/AMP-acid ligase II
MHRDDRLPQTLPALLAHAVAQHGDAPAAVTAAGALSYRQIAASSEELAKGLLALGVGKGARVGVLAGNSVFWIQSLFACAQIGAIMAPISTLATPPELAHIVRHSDIQVLLGVRRYIGRDYGQTIADALPSLTTARDPRRLRLAEAPFLRSVWLDDAQGLGWAGSVADLTAMGAADAGLDAAFLQAIASEVTPSDDAVVIYTSGSTAEPKAVLHTHGPMTRQAQTLAEVQIAKPGERVLCLLPMFWVGGMTMLLEVFVKGGCIVLPEGVSPRAIVDALRDLGADVLHGWPPQRSPVRALMQAEGLDFSGVRNLREERTPDGAPKPPDRTPNSLGMTESFGPHGALPVGATLPEHRRGAFAPVSGGFERRVVDPETGAVLPPGHVGELQIRGGALMRGYYKREYANTFTPDGFFPTSDRVRIEPDGYMYFEGRSGDMLKAKGANVSRLEVEGALRKVPGVADAVVCGLPDPEAGQIVVAAVTAATEREPTEAGIKTALRDLIAAYKIPSHIVVIDRDELRWTASGKIRILEMSKLVAERLGRENPPPDTSPDPSKT